MDLAVPPTRLKSFTALKNDLVPRKPEQDLSQYQLLIAGHSALVYSHRNVLVFPRKFYLRFQFFSSNSQYSG